MNFNEIYKQIVIDRKPTPIQKSVIEDMKFPKYLKAGAGSGKTEVLARKIINILKEDDEVDLQKFAIITFTNKATDEMKERIGKFLYYHFLKHYYVRKDPELIRDENFMRKQVELYNMIDISTIHGFCEKIIRDYGMLDNISPNFEIASIKNDQNKIIIEVMNKYYNNDVLSNIPEYVLKNLLEIFLADNENKGFIIDEFIKKNTDINTINNDYWNNFKKIFFEIYDEVYGKIEKIKLEKNILTSNDLVKRAAKLIENSYVINKLSDKYKYIFLDEFQDTNNNQFEIIDNLMKKGVKVFLVGDDKQSIYAFRGSDIENSRKMASVVEKLNHDEQITMTENFRTDYELLKIINEIFEHKFNAQNEELEFDTENLTKIEKLQGNDLSDDPFNIIHDRELVDVIKHLHDNVKIKDKKNTLLRNVQYGDIAVLCRSNFDLDNYAQLLKEKDIPVEVFGGKGFYKSKEIIDTFKLFNSVINQAKVYQTELKFTDYYKSIVTSKDEINFYLFIDELSLVFRKESIEGILDFIYAKSNIIEYYRFHQKYQSIANLHKLKDIAREIASEDFLQPIEFMEFLNNMIMSGKEEDEAEVANEDKSKGVVSLYSIHKSKGLEFPVVIIPKMEKNLVRKSLEPKIIFKEIKEKDDKKYGIAFKDNRLRDINIKDEDYEELLEDNTKEMLEEEIRIFYVATTRAEHKLILLTEDSSEVDKKNTVSWGKWIREIDNGNFERKYLYSFSI
ncbi:UvrD-helicase domain-containing protein [Tepidibacter hydrothermalis]|uniref:DNA 3'-5' helicase n=1 Tax=Tepidibacter hydrothermalis TaxID=3036126 RepID=A0ABY8EED5_9FIRM|nr:UvrD-helicase domain-containing protein [Tepidibacter hydrothermalis]WFD11313.1 UvrD-helicase domain-containing protein [Tepidibacter hydrothermalis]